jgi:hypothetical protein
LLADHGKPVVVICSQVKSRPGTSVMNAYETIRGLVYEELAKHHRDRLAQNVARELSSAAEELEKTGAFSTAVVLYALRFAARALTEQVPLLKQLRTEKPNVYWIEHWPEGTGLRSEVDYLLVQENEVGSPSWSRIDSAALAEQLGYKASDFAVPDEAVA